MLFTNRQARTATRFAPKHNRQANAAATLRCQYNSTLLTWMDCQMESQIANGVNTLRSPSEGAWYRFGNITQATASLQGLVAVRQGIKCYQMDGLNDVITYSNLNTLGLVTQALTIVTLHQATNAVSGIMVERTANYTTSTVGLGITVNTTGATAAIVGNVGTSSRTWATAQNVWKVGGYVLNKAAASGSEVLVYENGSQITSFTASSNAENTNDFGTVQTYYYGARGAAGTTPMAGYLADVMVFVRSMSAAEIAYVTQLVRWRAGFAV